MSRPFVMRRQSGDTIEVTSNESLLVEVTRTP